MSRLESAKQRAESTSLKRAETGYDLAALLNSIDNTLRGLGGGRTMVEPLGVPTLARQLTAGSASINTALTGTCRRLSMRAVGADIRFSIGVGAQTAHTDTSHFIAQDERLDFAIPALANIAIIRDAAVNGVLELTELA